MNNWKLKFDKSGAIRSHQMVTGKEENINNKIQLTCACCKEKINVGNKYFEYLVRPRVKNQIGKYIERVCIKCSVSFEEEDNFEEERNKEGIEYIIDELNLVEIRDDNIELKAMMKFKGLKFYVHPRDPDIFPSNPHAHVPGKGWKINLYTGEIYDVRIKRVIHKMPSKELNIMVDHFKKKGIRFNE